VIYTIVFVDDRYLTDTEMFNPK